MSKQDRLAFDRSASARSIGADGHMRILGSAVSKSNVCEYAGSEVPNAEELGLEPNKLYRLLRDPDALAAAAETLNGKPLMSEHRPQAATDYDADLVVGSLDNARWDAPYLRADITVWSQDAIDAIESGEQKQLSCGYRYTPVVEPGTYLGEPYDIIMKDLDFNHCALVTVGRAGADVVVGDSALPTPTTQPLSSREPRMQFVAKKLSRPALLAGAAVLTHIRPKLAADAKIDVTPIVAKVTAKTWKADKAKIKTALDAALKGKLAEDADIGDVIAMLDKLDDAVVEGAADDDLDEAAMDEDDETEEERKERLAKRAAAKAAAGAEDAEEPELQDGVPPTDNKVSKAAMDAAIKVAVAQAERGTIARMNDIAEATRAVRPFVGEIAVAQESAAAVYKLALDGAGVDLTGVPEVAYRAVFGTLTKPSDTAPKPARLATDAASTERFSKLFPDAPRVKHL